LNEGNYLGINANSSTTLTLATGQTAQYFGFYFTAGDGANNITLMSGATVLLNFSTATLISMLPRGSGNVITAINGSQYHTDDYYAKPGNVPNANSEPFAYIHFVATGSTTFDKIILSEGNAVALFENDNHSILTAAPISPPSLVYVAGTPIPEPASWSLSLVALGTFLLVRRR
jgi:hypothetical protein